MEAPVVPMKLASTVPIASRIVLVPGAPWMLPRTRMPPATVNRASSRRMKGMYSRSAVWARAWIAVDGPKASAMGTSTSKPHRAAILP